MIITKDCQWLKAKEITVIVGKMLYNIRYLMRMEQWWSEDQILKTKIWFLYPELFLSKKKMKDRKEKKECDEIQSPVGN